MMRGVSLLPLRDASLSLYLAVAAWGANEDWVRFGMFDVRKEIG